MNKIELVKEKVGKFTVTIGKFRTLAMIEGKEVSVSLQETEKGTVLKFTKHHDFTFGKQINGFMITEEQAELIKDKLQERDEEEKREEKRKQEEIMNSRAEYELGLDGGLYHFRNYSHITIETVLDILNERNVTKEIKDNGYCRTVVYDITNRELETILEETDKLIKQEAKIKKETSIKNEENRINDLKNKAKKTGKRQVVSVTSDECDDENEACDIDTITEYVNANGTFTTVRTHNW